MTAPAQTAADAADAAPAPRSASTEAKTARRALRRVLRPVRSSITAAIALQGLASVAAIAPYIAIAELGALFLAAGANTEVDAARVWWTVVVLVGAIVARAVLGGAALTITHYADARVQGVLRRGIVERLGRVPLGWFSQHSSGLVRKATQNDINDIHYLVAHGAVELTAAVCVPVVGIAYLAWLDWRLAILGVITIPVYLAAYAVMTRDMAERMAEMNAGIARISETIVEFVSGIAVVKAFGETGRAHDRYRSAAIDFGQAYDGWVRPMLRIDALASIALTAPVVLLVDLAGGTWLVTSGWVGPVDVIVAALVSLTIPVSILTIGFSMQSRREARAAAVRLVALLDTPVLAEPAHPRVPVSAEVRFEGVTFSYDGEHRVLDGVTLTLPVGTVTALVGPSGSGKSTLATLVPRFHDVEAGAVLVGGVDVRRIASDELYRHVGFVLQDVQLLAASVADNIRLGRPEATLEEVREAARRAQVDDRILALPRGYGSVVGEDALLSGGEAQRVAIARAILADPPVLVLDEATAFADPESEARIQEALSQLAGGRTLLVIAHRLSSVTDVDQIVVLDRGRVVESGRHADLVAAGGHYAQLWQAHEAHTATVVTR